MGVSFLCSVMESVLLSTTLSYINLRKEEGYAPAKLMEGYKENPSKPLAAILRSTPSPTPSVPPVSVRRRR